MKDKKGKSIPIWLTYFLMLVAIIIGMCSVSWLLSRAFMIEFFNINLQLTTDYISAIILLFTAIVIIKYTNETKRVADLQEGQYIPSVGHTIQSKWIRDDYYSILTTIVNHSNFEITALVFLDLYYIDEETKLEFTFDTVKKAYQGEMEWIIAPKMVFQGHFEFSSLNIPKIIYDQIKPSKIEFPKYVKLKIRLICNSKFNMPYISEMYDYDFAYKENEITDLIPQVIYPKESGASKG